MSGREARLAWPVEVSSHKGTDGTTKFSSQTFYTHCAVIAGSKTDLGPETCVAHTLCHQRKRWVYPVFRVKFFLFFSGGNGGGSWGGGDKKEGKVHACIGLLNRFFDYITYLFEKRSY